MKKIGFLNLPDFIYYAVRYSMVGGLGFITNAVTFFLIVDLGKLDQNFGATIAFVISMTQNYIINNKWAFADRQGTNSQIQKYVFFMCITALGMLASMAVMNLVIFIYHPQYKTIGQIAGIIPGWLVNFMLVKKFVFPEEKEEK